MRINALGQVCPNMPNAIDFKFDEFANEEIYEIIADTAADMLLNMNGCNWQDEPLRCNKILIPILTEYGLCRTFNAISPNETYTDE